MIFGNVNFFLGCDPAAGLMLVHLRYQSILLRKHTRYGRIRNKVLFHYPEKKRETGMYFNTDKRTPKLHADDLSRFLSLLTFRIRSVGFWHSDRDTQANYTSDDIEFVYYTMGGSRSIINNTEYECSVGDLMILPPASLVTSINRNHAQYEYLYIHFNVEPYHLESLFVEHLTHKTHVLSIGEEKNPEIGRVLNAIMGEIRSTKKGYQSVIDGCLRNLCVYVLRLQDFRQDWDQSAPGLQARRQFVSDVVKMISLNLDQPVETSDLARQFHVSESYLYKSFMSQLQLSPQQYIKKKRLAFALQALRSGDYTVGEVAQMVGFHSPQAFCSDIRQRTGMTPGQIAKEAAAKRMEEK